MKIYSYDTQFHYVGEAEADPDQMNPGEYILPAFATFAVPPAAVAGQVAVFLAAAERWEVQTEAAPAPPPAPVAEPFATKAARWKAAVTEYANMVAAALGFDDMAEAVSYADEPAVPKFQMQGAALRAWRSLLWAAFEDLCMHLSAGQGAEPQTPAELIALLPEFEVPDTASLDSTPYVAPEAPEEVAP